MLNVTLTGNLGRDPETRFTPNGGEVLQLSVAVNTRTREGDEWKDRTDWFRVSVWGGGSESVKRLTKGDRVLVVGRLRLADYTDRQGAHQISLDVDADAVESLTPRPRDGTEAAPPLEARPAGGGSSPTATRAGTPAEPPL
jgi:single-strand DNA-binding protein